MPIDDDEYPPPRNMVDEEEPTLRVKLEWCDAHRRNYVADEGCPRCQQEEDESH